MTNEFEDIRITGVDESASGGGDENSALVDVVLTLSESTPSEWATYFNQRWEQHIYMMKRRARGKHTDTHRIEACAEVRRDVEDSRRKRRPLSCN